VTLTVTDDDGATDASIAHVEVDGPPPPPPPPPPPENKTPRAEFEVQCPNADLTCTFTDRSTDEDGTIARRIWDYGDGTPPTEVPAGGTHSHTYAQEGTYQVTLTVTDDDGAVDSETHRAEPEAPPPPPNQPPTAVNDEYNTIEGADQTLNVPAAQGVLANDSDPENDPLTASNPSNPPNGSVSLNEDGSFSYTPDQSFFGDDQFTYEVKDPSGNSATGVVTIHVAPVNDSPRFTLKDDVLSANPGEPHVEDDWAQNISPGAPNESDQVLTFDVSVSEAEASSFTSLPSITRNEDDPSTGTLTFTLTPEASGEIAVTVVLHDNGGTLNGGNDTSAPQPFTIDVSGGRDRGGEDD
jgi:PKD repeat protein